MHCNFSVETLDYLQRGGRIGRAQALVGGLLGVRPILGLVDGEVVAVARVRGAARVLATMLDQFVEETPADGPIRVAIAHAQAPEQAAGPGRRDRARATAGADRARGAARARRSAPTAARARSDSSGSRGPAAAAPATVA